MSQVKFKYEEELLSSSCPECGIWFGMPHHFVKSRREDHRGFYCPNGHSLHYAAKSKVEELKEELDKVNQRLQESLGRENKLRIEHTKTKKRVFNGVCPCCNRSFVKLHAHMKSKHPDYKPAQRGDLKC